MDMTKHKTFRERNLTVMALVTTVATILLIIGSFQLAKVPFISGPSFHASFAESGGLKPGDPVEVAGLMVGKVTGVDLDGSTVKVDFTAKHVKMGNATTLQIKTGTLLGARYLAITPAGEGDLKPGSDIPLDRTTSPYNLTDSLSQVAAHTQKLDLNRIGQALHTFSDTFRQTSGDLTPAFKGVTALSRTISSRDTALRALFKRAAAVTGTFRQRTDQIASLVRDGNLIFAELVARRKVISRLILISRHLADEVSLVVKDNQPQLRPAMTQLNKVLDVLNKNSDNISVAIQRASAFITGLGEGVAHGPWFVGTIDPATGLAGQPLNLGGLTGGN